MSNVKTFSSAARVDDDDTIHEPEDLARFFVLYGDHGEYFMCLADTAAHAVEQANDATDGSHVHGVFRAVQDDSWIILN